MGRSADIYVVLARIGSNIGLLRENRGWSQSDFAKALGMQASYLNEVEAGKRNLAVKNLLKISQGLEVPLSVLFDGVDSNLD